MADLTTRRELAGRVVGIGGAVLGERFRPPRVAAAPDVPARVGDLTAGWLTAVLCRDAPGTTVAAFTVTDRTSGSTERGRIELTYAGRPGQLPPSVWFKSAPGFTNRLLTGLTNAAEAECRFYMDLRPGLDLLAPVGHHAVADRRSGRSFVMIEDLGRTRSASFGGPLDRHVTESMAESMVREMAAYHGALWESDRFGTDLRWLPDSLAWQRNCNAVMAFRKRSLIGIERAARVLAPGFIEHAADVWPALMRSLELNVSGPTTLLHQDVHAGNWYDADGEMGLYDWQCLARGGWALDVAYALMSGLTVEDRRAWERDLLRCYLERLSGAGVEAPTFAEAWLQYRQQVFHGLIFWLITIGAGRLQPAMQPVDIAEANLHRMSHAIMDLDAFAALSEHP